MSHESAPLDMFATQGTGFTEVNIKGSAIIFNQEVDKIIKALKDDEEYDDLEPMHFEMKKDHLKNAVGVINDHFQILIENHIKFVEEQEKVVYEICGFEYQEFEYFRRFDGVFHYFPEMSEIVGAFGSQCGECLQEIDNVVDYNDLDTLIYNEFKASVLLHILGLQARHTTFVELLMKQHVSNTWKEVDEFKKLYSALISAIQLEIEKVIGKQQAAREEVQQKNEKLDALINQISDPDAIVDIIIEEIKNLKISETLGKVDSICGNWTSYIEKNKLILDDVCDMLYQSEVAVNGLRLKGLVDLRAIKKLSFTEETEKQIASLNDEIQSILSKCLELSEKEKDATKKVIGLGGDQPQHD